MLGLANRYMIPIRTFRDWCKIEPSTNKRKICHDHEGRPRDIDKDEDNALVDDMKKRKDSHKPILTSEFNKRLVLAKTKSLARRNIKKAVVTVSKQQEKRVKQRLKIRTRKAKDITHARVVAARSIRATYIHAAIIVAFSGTTPATHKWNVDGTTFQSRAKGSGDKALVVIKDKAGADALGLEEEDDENDLLDEDGNQIRGPGLSPEVTSLQTPNDLSVFIKYMFIGNANGNTAPLVFIVAVRHMPAGEFFVRKVRGLTADTLFGASGYLYAAQSRAGNPALWKHFFLDIVVPAMKQVNNHRAAEVRAFRASLSCRAGLTHSIYYYPFRPLQHVQRVFLSLDGESIILQQMLTEEVLRALAEADTDGEKLPPSLTSKHQAADAAPTFESIKAGDALLTRSGTATMNRELAENLKQFFVELQQEFSTVRVSPVLKTKIIEGLNRLVYVMKEKYFSAEKIKRGFTVTGQHVEVVDTDEDSSRGGANQPAPEACTVDYEAIMGRTEAVCTAQELQAMRDLLPQMIVEVRRTGSGSKAFMDDIGVPQDRDEVVRDELTISRQHALLITHEDTVAKYRAMQAQKELLRDPVHIALLAKQTAARKLVVGAEKKTVLVMGRTTAKTAKADAVAAEKLRKSLLSPAQKKEEAANNRAAKEAAKLAAKEREQRALEEALDLLGPEEVALLKASVVAAVPSPAAAPAALPVDEGEEEMGEGEGEGEDESAMGDEE